MSRQRSKAHVLVVEDSPVQARQIRALLEAASFSVQTVADGLEALSAMQRSLPDVVLTDLQMPNMDGLELVGKVRCRYPAVPVVLMTAHGSEEIAVEALQRGAASYVPKRSLQQVIVGTLVGLTDVARSVRHRQRVLDSLTATESRFELENDHALISPLIAHLQDCVKMMAFCDDTDLIRISTALNEAIVNAMDHGNLELSTYLRQGWDEDAYYRAWQQRRWQRPYCDRRVHVTARLSRTEAVYVVRDEGPGFDPSSLPDPRDPANLEKIGGRGLLLIRTFMDQVCHNQAGNEITMIKRRIER